MSSILLMVTMVVLSWRFLTREKQGILILLLMDMGDMVDLLVELLEEGLVEGLEDMGLEEELEDMGLLVNQKFSFADN